MSKVEQHYDALLALHYSWLMGGFEECVARSEALLKRLDIRPMLSGKALDLGCGPGFQSIALAKAGFKVTALDQCFKMVAELKKNVAGLEVTPVQDDMENFAYHSPGQVDVVLCMGDTIAHLENRDAVVAFVEKLAGGLEPDGRLVLTFRDQSRELHGTDRFLQLRADDGRIFSVFLEYAAEHIDVTDLLHIRMRDGWKLFKSAYRKTRLTAESMKETCTWVGLTIDLLEVEQGLVTLVARK
ncbi:MAG: class I SAM-dependent methyltransferase [Proteobacteria bacterium]|nr:class I SAM-dependent methyltransferase [Pseudomonadota bacterium]